VLCDEHSIGGSGEYFGDNDAYLGIINVFYHEASGGKYLPRAVLFDLESGVIDALRACSRVVARLPHTSGNKPRRQNWAKDHNKRAQQQFFCLPPPPTPPPPLPPHTPVPKYSSLHLSSLHVLTQAQRALIRLPAAFASVPLGFILNRVC
jgi:hypothetical protein